MLNLNVKERHNPSYKKKILVLISGVTKGIILARNILQLFEVVSCT